MRIPVVHPLQNQPLGMGRRTHSLVLVALLGVSLAPAYGRAPKPAAAAAPATLKTEKREEKKGDRLRLLLELTVRPTWFQNEPTFHLENTAEIGFKIGDHTTLSYAQDFNSNESPAGRLSEAGNFTPVLQDGFLRMRFKNIRKSDDGLFTFSDQLRVYLPTAATKRDAGMLTAIRNYFVLNRSITPSFDFTFYECPILHVYDRDGAKNAKGDKVANPIFENRIILEAGLKPWSNVSIGIPLNFYLTRYRNFGDDAKLSGEWEPTLTFSPNVEWEIVPLVTLGFWYETGSLTQKTDFGVQWSDGQKSGYYQGYVRLAF